MLVRGLCRRRVPGRRHRGDVQQRHQTTVSGGTPLMVLVHRHYLPPPPEERGEPWTRCLVLEPGLPALYSAIAVLEPMPSGDAKCKHALRHLERFPPGTSY